MKYPTFVPHTCPDDEEFKWAWQEDVYYYHSRYGMCGASRLADLFRSDWNPVWGEFTYLGDRYTRQSIFNRREG